MTENDTSAGDLETMSDQDFELLEAYCLDTDERDALQRVKSRLREMEAERNRLREDGNRLAKGWAEANQDRARLRKALERHGHVSRPGLLCTCGVGGTSDE